MSKTQRHEKTPKKEVQQQQTLFDMLQQNLQILMGDFSTAQKKYLDLQNKVVHMAKDDDGYEQAVRNAKDQKDFATEIENAKRTALEEFKTFKELMSENQEQKQQLGPNEKQNPNNNTNNNNNFNGNTTEIREEKQKEEFRNLIKQTTEDILQVCWNMAMFLANFSLDKSKHADLPPYWKSLGMVVVADLENRFGPISDAGKSVKNTYQTLKGILSRVSVKQVDEENSAHGNYEKDTFEFSNSDLRDKQYDSWKEIWEAVSIWYILNGFVAKFINGDLEILNNAYVFPQNWQKLYAFVAKNVRWVIYNNASFNAQKAFHTDPDIKEIFTYLSNLKTNCMWTPTGRSRFFPRRNYNNNNNSNNNYNHCSPYVDSNNCCFGQHWWRSVPFCHHWHH